MKKKKKRKKLQQRTLVLEPTDEQASGPCNHFQNNMTSIDTTPVQSYCKAQP